MEAEACRAHNFWPPTQFLWPTVHTVNAAGLTLLPRANRVHDHTTPDGPSQNELVDKSNMNLVLDSPRQGAPPVPVVIAPFWRGKLEVGLQRRNLSSNCAGRTDGKIRITN